VLPTCVLQLVWAHEGYSTGHPEVIPSIRHCSPYSCNTALRLLQCSSCTFMIELKPTAMRSGCQDVVSTAVHGMEHTISSWRRHDEDKLSLT
jgi:hypothetical protein